LENNSPGSINVLILILVLHTIITWAHFRRKINLLIPGWIFHSSAVDPQIEMALASNLLSKMELDLFERLYKNWIQYLMKKSLLFFMVICGAGILYVTQIQTCIDRSRSLLRAPQH